MKIAHALFIGLAVPLVVSCTTGGSYKQGEFDFAGVKPQLPPSVTYAREGDRVPANSPELRWAPAELTFKVKSPQASEMGIVKAERIMSWIEQVAHSEIVYEEKEMLDPNGICYDMVCTGDGGGKSEAWNAFYSAPKELKAEKLDIAIKGVGKKTAEALIRDGYFSKKPRSWDEFSREIQRAADHGTIQKSLVTKILYQYRNENIANLGYEGNTCKEKARTCSTWVTKLVPREVITYTPVERRKVVEERLFDVRVQVANSKLLSFETDTISLSFNENGEVMQSTYVGRYNRYVVASTVSGRNVSVTMIGESRNLVPLSDNVIRRDAFQMVSGEAVFALEIDTNYLPTAEDPSSQLVLNYSLYSCNRNFFGACKLSEQHQIVKTGQVALKDARTLLNFSPPGSRKKLWVSYQLSRRNSQYFRDEPTGSRMTAEIAQ